MNEIIYLEPDEEITAVIDRLKLTMSRLAVLVIPRGSSIAQSVVNLKLLKRTAEGLEKEVAMVTGDRITRNLASQVGITVYSKVSEAEKAKPKEEIGKAGEEKSNPDGLKVHNYSKEEFASAEPEEPEAEKPKEDEIDDEPIMETRKIEPKPEEPRTPGIPIGGRSLMPKNYQKKTFKKFFVILGLTLVVLIGAAFVFLPNATAKIQLKTEEYNYDGGVTVNRNIDKTDTGTSVIPGKLYQIEKESKKSFPAIGTKDVGEKATGKITVSNTFDVSSHKFAKGTKFTAKGKNFLADAEFTLPGATISLIGGEAKVTPGQVSVNVTAEAAGDSYNLGASDYVIENAPSKITGSADQISGGVTKTVKVVTEQDLADAATNLTDEMNKQFKSELIDQAKGESYLMLEPGLVSDVVSATHSKNANDEADSFDTTVRLKLSGLGFLEKDLRDLLVKTISDKLESGKMLINPDKSDITFVKVETDENVETTKIALTYKGRIADKVGTGPIADSIKNKKASEAELVILRNDKFEDVELKVWPSFWKRTPLIKSRIKITFDYAKN